MTDFDITNVIPKEFYEIDNFDRNNRQLVGIFIRQPDDSYGNEVYKRGRLANVKKGNVFVIVNGSIPSDYEVKPEDTRYRATSDAYFSRKLNQVMIDATTLDDYLEEQSVESDDFKVPDYDPCRKK